jgi:hypothetical protein
VTRRATLWVILLIALASGAALWHALRTPSQENAYQARALATRRLAEVLSAKFPGSRALVLSNPFTHEAGTPRAIAAMEEAGVRGLKEGFGQRLALAGVVFPELKPGARDNPRAFLPDAETSTPLSHLVAEDALDRLAAQHPECDVIVSLIGLPAALDRVRCWQTNAPPRFALLLPDLRFIGDATAVRNAVQRGKLAAFVLHKPGAPDSRAAVGRDAAAEFEKRFVLVTAENVEEVMRRHPQLFPAE